MNLTLGVIASKTTMMLRLAEVQGILRTQYTGNEKYQPIHNGSKKLVQNTATDTQALLSTKVKFDNAFQKSSLCSS